MALSSTPRAPAHPAKKKTRLRSSNAWGELRLWLPGPMVPPASPSAAPYGAGARMWMSAGLVPVGRPSARAPEGQDASRTAVSHPRVISFTRGQAYAACGADLVFVQVHDPIRPGRHPVVRRLANGVAPKLSWTSSSGTYALKTCAHKEPTKTPTTTQARTPLPTSTASSSPASSPSSTPSRRWPGRPEGRT